MMSLVHCAAESEAMWQYFIYWHIMRHLVRIEACIYVQKLTSEGSTVLFCTRGSLCGVRIGITKTS